VDELGISPGDDAPLNIAKAKRLSNCAKKAGRIVTWVAESAVEHDIIRAVADRWRVLDSMLPDPGRLAPGCGETFRTPGGDGFAVCRHLIEPADSMGQTWAATTRYVLSPRLAGPDVGAGLDQLLAQWRVHVSGMAEAHAEDTATRINWPSRDTAGVRALIRHGMTPMTVIAARPAQRATGSAPTGSTPTANTANTGVTIRQAGPADLAAVVAFQLGVIRYDEQFGVGRERPATETLVREEMRTALHRQPSWIWLAQDARRAEPAGLLVFERPEQASWVAPLTGLAPVAYLATLFVQPGHRGGGVGAALAGQAHAAADAHGVALTLLHYAQLNPVSGPFWNRMGYRPLWTGWETSPAGALR
jgi:GNAT superfamily N-acetyltransferase